MSWNAVFDNANIYIPFEKFGKYLSASAAKVYPEHENGYRCRFLSTQEFAVSYA